MPRGVRRKYPGDEELSQLCDEMGLTVRQAIRACRGWNPDRYYRLRKAYGRIPAEFALALADLTTRLPEGPRLSGEEALRLLRVI
jgi:hypothetical protein